MVYLNQRNATGSNVHEAASAVEAVGHCRFFFSTIKMLTWINITYILRVRNRGGLTPIGGGSSLFFIEACKETKRAHHTGCVQPSVGYKLV